MNTSGKTHEDNLINERENFFHKPQVALNHYFNINDKMNLISSASSGLEWVVVPVHMT